MNWSAILNYKPKTIEVTIETYKPEKIWLCVYDFENQKRKFTERHMVIDGKMKLQVMMPQTPKKCLIVIYNERNGKTKNDNSFKVFPFRQSVLKQDLDIIGLQNNDVRNFVKFAQNFCYYLQELPAKGELEENGELSSGLYRSNNKKFFIELFPTIKAPNGTEVNTPARTNKATGEIEVSKKAFYNLTIPEMMAILLHEFSHFYISDNIDDESEADLNGLLIYLGLGYPRIEAAEAWGGVFEKANNAQNRERYELIHQFINDFDNKRL